MLGMTMTIVCRALWGRHVQKGCVNQTKGISDLNS